MFPGKAGGGIAIGGFRAGPIEPGSGRAPPARRGWPPGSSPRLCSSAPIAESRQVAASASSHSRRALKLFSPLAAPGGKWPVGGGDGDAAPLPGQLPGQVGQPSHAQQHGGGGAAPRARVRPGSSPARGSAAGSRPSRCREWWLSRSTTPSQVMIRTTDSTKASSRAAPASISPHKASPRPAAMAPVGFPSLGPFRWTGLPGVAVPPFMTGLLQQGLLLPVCRAAGRAAVTLEPRNEVYLDLPPRRRSGICRGHWPAPTVTDCDGQPGLRATS